MGILVNVRAWLDATPLSSLALAVMREATGRERPLDSLLPLRAVALPVGVRVAFWSLCAGVGASTTAALVAQRSASAGVAPVLVDLDRWAPSLALRAHIEGATVADALLAPGRERRVLSRWSGVPFLPGAPASQAMLEGRIPALVDAVSGDGAAIVDLGAGADAIERGALAAFGQLVVVAGTTAAQLQAAFCAVPLLRELPCRVGLVIVGAAEEDARSVATRLPWPLYAAIPRDPYLATDAFAARAPTLRAVDSLIQALA